MIKYKVSEVAKDLNVPSKAVIEAIKECCGVTKKSGNVLTDQELNVVFEYFTQKNQVENFDKYYASRDSEPEKAEKADKPAKAKDEKSKGDQKQGQKKNNQQNNSQKKQDKPQDKKPAQKAQAKKEEPVIEQEQSRGRVINTRAAQVDIERYNEKYDRMASEKLGGGKKSESKTTTQKQKFTQRSQQRGKSRSAKRETEKERLERIAAERKAKPITVSIPDEITVGELALRLKATAAEVIKKLFMMGTMVTVNDVIDFDTASLAAMEFHAKVEKEVVVTIEERIIDDSEDDDDNLVTRAPVVVVMGHVDHGKTSLLDAIRKTNVIEGEAGGITQHIGAYKVSINGREITFLDTPGHEAFTSMRARGAQITDVAILVVAADDGVMPQTVEAINHAKAAGIPIIVAINKIDVPGANPEKVKQELMKYELVPEEWGGDTVFVEISAKQHINIDQLLEMVLLVSDMQDLKVNPNKQAKGVVIEARLDKAKGPIASVLVQRGSLDVGDTVVVGTSIGRIRAMKDDKGKRVKCAGPSTPVEIMGLTKVPEAGETFYEVKDEKMAKHLIERRERKAREDAMNAYNKVTLSNLFEQMEHENLKQLNIIVKADVQGTAEALKQSLEKLSDNEVAVKVIHSNAGAINESDVNLAKAAKAIIIGFNVRPNATAKEVAEKQGVEIKLYSVIYQALEDVEAAMNGLLDPVYEEKVIGNVEVRQTFKVSNVGTIAGGYVKDGKVERNAGVRVIREDVVIHEGKLASLKRFKDDVKEVAKGFECGLQIENYNDIKEGDIIEVFVMEEIKRTKKSKVQQISQEHVMNNK